MPKPEYRVIRKEIYDPTIEDYVSVELPTETIKKHDRLVAPGARLLSSYTGLGNKRFDIIGGSADVVGRVTRLSFNADRQAECWLIDRSGTVDTLYLEAAGRETLLGKWDQPVYVLKGTVKFYLGSYAAGTFAVSYEILKRHEGTQTVR